MAFLRSDFEQYTLLGGLSFQGSTVDFLAVEAADDCFDLIGCPDISKQTTDYFSHWEVNGLDPEGEGSAKDEIDELLEQFDFGGGNPFLAQTDDKSIFGPEDSTIQQIEETLEDFLEEELRNQINESLLSQPQQNAPAKSTKIHLSHNSNKASPPENSLLLDSSLLSLTFSASQDLSLPLIASQTCGMTLQIEAVDEVDSNRAANGEFYKCEHELTDDQFAVPFVENDLSFELLSSDNSRTFEDTFAMELELSQFAAGVLQTVEESSTRAGLSGTRQTPHVHFENSYDYIEPSLELDQLSNELAPLFVQNLFYETTLQDLSQRHGTEFDFDNNIDYGYDSAFQNSYVYLNAEEMHSATVGITPLILSTVPRSFPEVPNLPIPLRGLLDFGIGGLASINEFNRGENYQFGSQLTPFNSSTTGSSSNRNSPPRTLDGNPDDSKPERPKRPKKEKRKFDYSSVKPKNLVVKEPHLQNVAKNPPQNVEEYESVLIELWDPSLGAIKRIRHIRGDIDYLHDLHPHVFYERNPYFKPHRPYQQEFTRVELNPLTGAPIMETRSALCVYCENFHFYELKNSCYSQHMSHSHGIYTDDYLTPDPLLIGRYLLSKKSSPTRKTLPRQRSHEGVVCPACYEVVEILCWSSTKTTKPLSNYLRHFKEKHRVEKRKETFFRLHA
ncbi:hypothetical protein METBIDRAFT_230395 [Metschnikowia bicuspidata var. bicuspidata NRRL YB-4993]|uniref:Transcription regulator Rua1 C-terminal domain-containing protein n=1 Tax=Metschnikowia bicuspidata var. bicuspidata NRRL YB-4993 TaxID=869754 RepID=A0A1A0H7G5_9ASCO|nr:hypothetical protein METBIDRAFT_230395 [Metschnikowia bicuspidata var. bicuspidata NRRL YB-4993]OBA19843.1 hypothetical protein METBIDRAFT_230395 [Metschnikowia bicuspidata var. bicuspidata NRRL YB-4993]